MPKQTSKLKTLVTELELRTLESGSVVAAADTEAFEGGKDRHQWKTRLLGEQFDGVAEQPQIDETAIDLEALAAIEEAAETEPCSGASSDSRA